MVIIQFTVMLSPQVQKYKCDLISRLSFSLQKYFFYTFKNFLSEEISENELNKINAFPDDFNKLVQIFGIVFLAYFASKLLEKMVKIS